MTSPAIRRRLLLLPALLALVGSSLAVPAAASSPVPSAGSGAVFFAADGLRQDLVAGYAAQGRMPTMASFLKGGTKAAGNGLLTEAPPNTGAGWYSLATGAWPGVHRLHEQHVPHQRGAVRQPDRRLRRRTCSRPSRSPRAPSVAA